MLSGYRPVHSISTHRVTDASLAVYEFSNNLLSNVYLPVKCILNYIRHLDRITSVLLILLMANNYTRIVN